jgi:hypothetical protein
MNPGNLLSALALDAWYKVTMYVSGVVLILALFLDVKGIQPANLQLLALGVLLLSLGEWKNHKVQSYIKPPNVYTGPTALIEATVRKPDLVGVLLVLSGAGFIVLGILRVLHVVASASA